MTFGYFYYTVFHTLLKPLTSQSRPVAHLLDFLA